MYLELLAIALATGLSPIVIGAFMRVLFSEHRALAVPAFVAVLGALAWLVPLVVGRAFGAATGHSDGDDAVTTLDVVAAAALALVLLGLAVRQLVAGDASGKDGDGASGGEDRASVSVGGALGLAAAVMVLNPKSIALMLAAGDVIGTETEQLGEAAVAAASFALFVAGPFAGVGAYQALGGAAADARIAAAQAWLDRHGKLVKASVLGLIGLYFAVKAITGLGKL